MASVVRIGDGVYLVSLGEGPQDGDNTVDSEAAGAARHAIVYVAGSRQDRWVFWNGRVFRQSEPAPDPVRHQAASAVQSLTAPMPATVVAVLVEPGQAVKAGDTLILVEAMKMELPIRAPGDGVVKAVHCQKGEIVQPDRTLVELAS